jgi:cation diffusion facilitator family transporter
MPSFTACCAPTTRPSPKPPRTSSTETPRPFATEYLHYVSDTFVYIGILVSLVLYRFTNLFFWDPLISLLIVVYLVWSVFGVFNDSLGELLDKQLPDSILKDIDSTIRGSFEQVVDYHDLRTRKVGDTKFIEFHVVLRNVQRFDEAHDITEGLIQRIRKKYPGSIVTVHTDPEGAMEEE